MMDVLEEDGMKITISMLQLRRMVKVVFNETINQKIKLYENSSLFSL